MTNQLRNGSRVTIARRGQVSVLPVRGIPGRDGEDGQPGQQGPPGDSVVEDPPVNLVVLFENALAGHV